MDAKKMDALKTAAGKTLRDVSNKLLLEMVDGKDQEQSQLEVIREHGEIAGPILVSAAVTVINSKMSDIENMLLSEVGEELKKAKAGGASGEEFDKAEEAFNQLTKELEEEGKGKTNEIKLGDFNTTDDLFDE